MRISQPANCEVTTQILNRLSGRFEVSVALWHVFSILPGQADPEDPRILWTLAKKHSLAQGLDEGFPKSRGEFLCYGLAYPPAGLQSGPFSVSVRVESHQRKLAVFGKREFGVLGGIRELGYASNPIAISPDNAFGGKDYAENPAGIGWQAKGGDKAPPVEDPDQLLDGSTRDALPAGFWPLSPASRVRKKHLGAFDDAWLQREWPAFPPDTHLDFFQTAPEKQRLDAHFKGNETCEITNMNEQMPLLRFNLPRKRARCVFRRGEDQGVFHGWRESPMVAETLYLFPNEGVAALLHRSVIVASRADARDVQDVLLALEKPGEQQPAEEIILQLFKSQLLDIISAE
jgi:hypothetical protein